MIVTIHQPDFFPWLGFFDRIKSSDIFIILDDVQFLRRGWHHRDYIKTKDGKAFLTVPVLKKSKFNQLIKDVEIENESNWRKKHLNTIKTSYKKAPNFPSFFDKIENIYNKNHTLLIDLNLDLLDLVFTEFNIQIKLCRSSEFNITSKSSERLVELVKCVNGTKYLTGLGSKDYLEEELFEKEGINVLWQDFKNLEYNQLHGDFIKGLSVLDYLMMRK